MADPHYQPGIEVTTEPIFGADSIIQRLAKRDEELQDRWFLTHRVIFKPLDPKEFDEDNNEIKTGETNENRCCEDGAF